LPTAQDHLSPHPRPISGAPPCPHHARPWRRGSVFGDGPRRMLAFDQRRAWLARVEAERRAGNLPGDQDRVAKALLSRLSRDGRCDPSYVTLAADSGTSESTVGRAVRRLHELKLLAWERRLVRREWPAGGKGATRAEQTSNAYELLLPEGPLVLRERRPVQAKLPLRCDGQAGREISSEMIHRGLPPLNEVEKRELKAIQEARSAKFVAEWQAQRTERWRTMGRWKP
jgi:hypothetical protein